MVELGSSMVLALLSVIATIDLMQFGLQLRHERRITRIEVNSND